MSMKQKTAKSIVTSSALDEFAAKLVIAKDYGSLDADVFEELKRDILDRLEDSINMNIISAIPEAKFAEFQRLLEKEDFEKIKSFCQKNVPELDNLVKTTMQNFANIYLEE